MIKTKDQIKTEINKVLDSVPEEVLKDLLNYLKEIQDKSSDKIKLSKNLRKILSEDQELLEKLAQ